MAKKDTAVFTQNPRTVVVSVTAASGVADDVANLVKLFDGGTEGSLLRRLTAMPRGTVTASQLRLYISFDNGATARGIDSELMAAQTVSATTKTTKTVFADISREQPIAVPAGASIWVGIAVALVAGIVFAGQVEDF